MFPVGCFQIVHETKYMRPRCSLINLNLLFLAGSIIDFHHWRFWWGADWFSQGWWLLLHSRARF